MKSNVYIGSCGAELLKLEQLTFIVRRVLSSHDMYETNWVVSPDVVLLKALFRPLAKSTLTKTSQCLF